MKGAVVMAKSTSVYARIDSALKEQAETILSALGIPTSNAIDMFSKQIVLKKGLPFEVRLPYEKPVCVGALSKEELNAISKAMKRFFFFFYHFLSFVLKCFSLKKQRNAVFTGFI